MYISTTTWSPVHQHMWKEPGWAYDSYEVMNLKYDFIKVKTMQKKDHFFSLRDLPHTPVGNASLISFEAWVYMLIVLLLLKRYRRCFFKVSLSECVTCFYCTWWWWTPFLAGTWVWGIAKYQGPLSWTGAEQSCLNEYVSWETAEVNWCCFLDP